MDLVSSNILSPSNHLSFQARFGSRRLISSLSLENGSKNAFRRWPLTLKLPVLLSSSTTPFEYTCWIVNEPIHLGFNFPGKMWSLES